MAIRACTIGVAQIRRTPAVVVDWQWLSINSRMVKYLAKFLLLIAVFIVAYMVIKGSSRRRDERQQAPRSGAEDMVRCKVCGIHLPRSESLKSNDEFFCSEEHLRIAKK